MPEIVPDPQVSSSSDQYGVSEPAFTVELFGTTFMSEGMRPGYDLGAYTCAECEHHADRHLCVDVECEPEDRVFLCEIVGCGCSGWRSP